MYRMFNITSRPIPGNHMVGNETYQHINRNSSCDVPDLVPVIHIDFSPIYKKSMCMTLYDDELPIDKRIERLYFENNGDVITISIVARCISVYGWPDGSRFVVGAMESYLPVKLPVIRFTFDDTNNFMDSCNDGESIMGIKLRDLYHRGLIFSDDGVFIFNRVLSTVYEVNGIIKWPRKFMGFSLNEIFEHLGHQIEIVDIRTETKDNINVN